jgi:DNA-binding transcriptional MerR regulator
MDENYQIGEVAERVGLSLRTIRYYEEIGLAVPSGRTEGGFRLYREADIKRLELVKALKPLGMPLEDLVELLELCEEEMPSARRRQRRAELLDLAGRQTEKMARQLANARRVLQQLTGT